MCLKVYSVLYGIGPLCHHSVATLLWEVGT